MLFVVELVKFWVWFVIVVFFYGLIVIVYDFILGVIYNVLVVSI